MPLLAAFQAAAGDHWYTTDPVEHSNLLSLGWTDAGIIAYVLPLSESFLVAILLRGAIDPNSLRLFLQSMNGPSELIGAPGIL